LKGFQGSVGVSAGAVEDVLLRIAIPTKSIDWPATGDVTSRSDDDDSVLVGDDGGTIGSVGGTAVFLLFVFEDLTVFLTTFFVVPLEVAFDLVVVDDVGLPLSVGLVALADVVLDVPAVRARVVRAVRLVPDFVAVRVAALDAVV